jgi:hypothetical protein
MARESFESLHVGHNRKTLHHDVQTDRPLRLRFIWSVLFIESVSFQPDKGEKPNKLKNGLRTLRAVAAPC